MTRREEIENHIGYKITKAAVEYYQANCANDVDLLDAFEAGAEWMQETMIDKAINWLKENASNYIVDIGGRWECKTIVGGMCWVDLRKYLEE